MIGKAPLLMAVAVIAFGQVAPTRVGQHQIGETLQDWQAREPVASPPRSDIAPHKIDETFAEWLRLNNLDLTSICQKRHEKDEHHTDFKAVCKNLSAIRDSGHGEFYTTTQTGQTFGWTFVNGHVADYSVNGKHPDLEQFTASMGAAQTDPNVRVTRTDSREFTWKFLDGKLAEVTVTPNWLAIYAKYSDEGIALHPEVVPAFQDEVDFLTQVYGKPSTVKPVPYSNAFGAQWERMELFWTAPDGTQIAAFERTGFNQQGQLALVSFHSKESLQKSEPTKPNPYKQ
jgi:hypothetical protein